jgi:hypothetical protein
LYGVRRTVSEILASARQRRQGAPDSSVTVLRMEDSVRLVGRGVGSAVNFIVACGVVDELGESWQPDGSALVDRYMYSFSLETL